MEHFNLFSRRPPPQSSGDEGERSDRREDVEEGGSRDVERSKNTERRRRPRYKGPRRNRDENQEGRHGEDGQERKEYPREPPADNSQPPVQTVQS